jgi:sugar lactone lactonase YvrE
VEEICAAKDSVGESIIWDDRNQTLFWVDIGGKRIHRLDRASGNYKTWNTPDFVTSIGLRKDGGAIVGQLQDVALWDFGNTFTPLAHPEPDWPGNRLNEGVVAPDGSFWVGTMQNNLNPDGSPKDMDADTGALYRIAPDGHVTRLSQNNIGITNTMAWTKDGQFISADTTTNTLYIYDHDSSGHAISNRREFLARYNRGLPDGSTMDAQGHLWNCRVVGGNSVIRITPEGTIDRVVELPCSWPTSCTFGGVNFDTLYVTSARIAMTEAHLAETPCEGSVFAVRTDVTGLPTNRFG